MNKFREYLGEDIDVEVSKETINENVKEAIFNISKLNNLLDDIRTSGGVKQIKYDKAESRKIFDEVQALTDRVEKFVKSYN